VSIAKSERAVNPSIVKVIIIVCLVGIVASLSTGLFYLVSDKGKSKSMVRALTVRIVLSVVLFLFLLLAWWQGWIQPHGVSR
jgi:succinate dehydrogenase/fumarate reductase cytochrome b subunit